MQGLPEVSVSKYSHEAASAVVALSGRENSVSSNTHQCNVNPHCMCSCGQGSKGLSY